MPPADYPTDGPTVVLLRVQDLDNSRYQEMPPLRAHELTALTADIQRHGVLEPIHVDEHHRTIAGHHRVAVCQALNIPTIPAIIDAGLAEAEKTDRALVLELARRHLDQAQKRSLIEKKLIDLPDRSDRDWARILAVSPTTVGSVRTRLEQSGAIPRVSERVGRDAKTRSTPTVQSGQLDGEGEQPEKPRTAAGQRQLSHDELEQFLALGERIDAAKVNAAYKGLDRDRLHARVVAIVSKLADLEERLNA